MSQFTSTSKSLPWARQGTDLGGGGLAQQAQMQSNILAQPVAAGQPGMYNLGTSQNLQSQALQTQALQTQALQNQALQNQFQQQVALQQQAQSIVQSQQQQTAVLPQPGIALPTSLASAPNVGTVSYPSLKSQQPSQGQQATGQKQRVFTGTVTKLHDNFGFIDEDVFFQTTCVKGLMPKAGDRVLVEAQFNANLPFKWNATRIQVLPSQGPHQNDSRPMGKESSRFDGGGQRQPRQGMDQEHMGRPRGNRRERFERDRPPRRRDDRDNRINNRGNEKSFNGEGAASGFGKRSRSPKKSASPIRKSRSPVRKRNRVVVPRYMVQVPKFSLDFKSASVVSLKTRFTSLYVPSDFFNASFPWQDSFPLTRPFQLGKHCNFHVLHKDVERLGVGQNTAVLDPPDADHLYSAKVMLLSCPSLDTLYHKACSLAQDPESIQENFAHPTRLLNFLVGVKGKNEPIAIGGPWSPSLDGENPTEDPHVLIKTAIRTCKAFTGINLNQCTQWYRFAEVRYLRPEETHKGKLVPARVETTVIFLPDVWSCHPTHLDWETHKMAFKKQLQKKLTQIDGKEDTQEEEEEGDVSLGEIKEPSHYADLDPKTMKIVDLRRELECRTLSSKGLKSQLIARLTKALKSEQEKEKSDDADKKENQDEEAAKEEEPMEPEEDEEKKKKEEEEKKKEDERKRQVLERRYNLPDKPNILVYPNATAKGGKFDCAVMSLSVLLDYRPEDNKEHSFEVSLFAELFNELLMRDFGFQIFKGLSQAPEKPKEEDKKKKDKKKEEKSEEKEEDKEPAVKKKKTEEKEKKDSDKKEEKEDDKKEGKKEETKEEKEKREKKEKKKYITVDPNLLLSFIYFDQNHTGYLLDKDAEEILHAIGLSQSRAQIKKLLGKVVTRDSLNYRKLTDKPEQEEASVSDKAKPMEIDAEKLVAGNMALIPKKAKKEEAASKKKGPTKTDGEPLSGMVMYNGAMLDIDSVLQRLEKSEKSSADLETKLDELTNDKEKAKKTISQKEENVGKLKEEIKNLKHQLTTQEKITTSSETSNKKYLSALIESQGLLNSLTQTVTTALGDKADGHGEVKDVKVKEVKVKDEPMKD